jgi:hypothetical protein
MRTQSSRNELCYGWNRKDSRRVDPKVGLLLENLGQLLYERIGRSWQCAVTMDELREPVYFASRLSSSPTRRASQEPAASCECETPKTPQGRELLLLEDRLDLADYGPNFVDIDTADFGCSE